MESIIEPLVSVVIITYNHEKYIKQCLDGVLMQQASFSFEILINDDASTDHTALIVKEYASKYSNIIKPIYQEKNQYSQGVHPWFDILFPKVQGKYIAICEGDDYWIDPMKLQKQVDFMETNPEYGLVYTNFVVHEQGKHTIDRIADQKCYSGNVLNELIRFNFIATLTVCFRTELLYKINFEEISSNHFMMGDYPMWIEIANLSKINYINEVTSTYRVLSESAMHTRSYEKKEKFLISNLDIQLYYLKKIIFTNVNEDEIISNNYNILLDTSFAYGNYAKAKEYAEKIFVKKEQYKMLLNNIFYIKYVCTKNRFYFNFYLLGVKIKYCITTVRVKTKNYISRKRELPIRIG